MKKLLIFSLLLIVACGSSEEEIQERIDQAVDEAVEEVLQKVTTTTSSTTTVPPTTTTTTTFPQSVGFVENEFVGSTINYFKINYELISSNDFKKSNDLFTIKFQNGTYYVNYILLWFNYFGQNQRDNDIAICLLKIEKVDFIEPTEFNFGCQWRLPDTPMLQDFTEGTFKLRSISLTSDFSGQEYLYKEGSNWEKTLLTRYYAGPDGTWFDCNYSQNKKCKFVNTEVGIIPFIDYEPKFYENQGVFEDSFIGLSFKIDE